MPVSVLLVDDQPLVRAGFRLILESAPNVSVVGEASDGREAVREVRGLLPDVVLMDIRMPGVDGIQATRQIVEWARPLGHRVRVLALTTFDLDEYVIGVLRAGASGFLLKDVPPAELVSAVELVAGGASVISPTVLNRLLDRFAPLLPSPEAGPEPSADTLTVRERQVLRLAAKGWSNGEIAAHLVLGEATVKSHVGSILTKLGLRDRVQAVVHAYETGLVRPGQDDHPNEKTQEPPA
ncbi:DNA-binding NarL/FixJ family response regulator [Nocardiopsis terrae]|uniref:DNA-binding NarL/FixJ family response regulator n=1 Tax=Nocardiopsis terrae TaxID=372655 RepID=A0ABR9HIJ1_9ACTN|nr:response regulator transcription factor [Nocardiopsis terrae]MBE1458836.1 DNA-binding NarL/FixJ family response regulator [Nocardiopsis terrae]